MQPTDLHDGDADHGMDRGVPWPYPYSVCIVGSERIPWGRFDPFFTKCILATIGLAFHLLVIGFVMISRSVTCPSRIVETSPKHKLRLPTTRSSVGYLGVSAIPVAQNPTLWSPGMLLGTALN